MDYFKCLTSTHIFTLVLLHYVPWFPFSLSMGYHASVNGIHQWPIIRRCSIMFDLDTFICMMGHVLVAICVEDLRAWWNSIYSTSLIVLVFMRCQLSWLDSSVYQISSSLRISWFIVYCTWWWPHMTFVYHAYSWPLYSYVFGTAICCSHMQRLIILFY